jgi:hypothetical protein
VNFDTLNWDILDRLRATFLEGKPARRAYWTSEEDLAQYDVTFGERIGWKWDAVLHELQQLGWTPPSGVERVIDWGCGSGVAGRRVLAACPSLRALEVHDHSRLAVSYAVRMAQGAFPGIVVRPASPAPEGGKDALWVLSHVCNELDSRAEARLLAALSSAGAILWVEPGTHEVGRRMQSIREGLRARFDVIAPCPHQRDCPLLLEGRGRDWCHHFARPPAHVFTDGNWVRFARRAGIDLRGLPYSYLALQARPDGARPAPVQPWSRILGRIRLSKSAAAFQACGPDGIEDVQVRKQANPEAFARLSRNDAVGREVIAKQMLPREAE